MTSARRIAVVPLLALAALLLLVANVGLWVDKTVYNTDTFVAAADGIRSDPDVQQAMATRFADRIINSSQLNGKLQAQLPDNLKFLAIPVRANIEDLLQRVALRVLQTDRFRDQFDAALRVLHAKVIDTINNGDFISRSGNQLVIDLRPMLQGVIDDLGLPDNGGGGPGTLRNAIDLPPDAGTFVVDDSGIAWGFGIARYLDNVLIGLAIAAPVMFLIALAVSTNRRKTLRTTGIIVAATGLVSLLLLVPVRMVVSNYADNSAAGVAVVNILTQPYQVQSFVLIAAGAVILAVAFLLGGTRLATAIRDRIRGRELAEPFGRVVGDYAMPLRIAGIAAAVVALVTWPDPSTRVQVTIIALLAAWLLLIWAVTGDSSPARSLREQASELGGHHGHAGAHANGSVAGRIDEHAGLLRVAGVVVAGLTLMFAPTVTLGVIVAIVLILVAYLTGIEWAVGRTNH